MNSRPIIPIGVVEYAGAEPASRRDMTTAREMLEKANALIKAGKGDDNCHHWVDHSEEAKRRAENKPADGKKPSTKFVIETFSPQMYSELHIEKERIMAHVPNKTMALEFLLRAWKELTEEKMDEWLHEGEPPTDDLGPPRAQFPERF